MIAFNTQFTRQILTALMLLIFSLSTLSAPLKGMNSDFDLDVGAVVSQIDSATLSNIKGAVSNEISHCSDSANSQHCSTCIHCAVIINGTSFFNIPHSPIYIYKDMFLSKMQIDTPFRPPRNKYLT